MCWPLLGASELSFRLAVINERPDKPGYVLSQYGKFLSYIRQKLSERGVRFEELLIARDVTELANEVVTGDVDAVVEGVMATLAIKRRTAKLVPALVIWRKGQRQYHSVFFVRKDSSITGLLDLLGKTIVFESPRSTSAYHVPRAALRGEGMILASQDKQEVSPNFIRYLFAGSELNQAYWVVRGRADAGAFNNGDWDRIPEIIKNDLRIIHTTRPMLRWLLSFTSDIDPRLRSSASEVFLAAHQDQAGREALKEAARIAKFEVLTDTDKMGLEYWDTILSRLQ